MLHRLRLVHAIHRRTYGRPRLHRALQHDGIRIGEKRVRRLMRMAGLTAVGRRTFRVTTDSAHAWPVAGNHLQRRFGPARPHERWAADITALPTRVGWCYLAVVLDLGSRRVVGWAVRSSLETELVLAALHTALGSRPAPALHHSDRGVHYSCAAYLERLSHHGLRPSLSRLGDCWDNAVVESFFHSLKIEWLAEAQHRNRREAKQAVFEYIEVWYNRQRRHSSLGYLSPAEYERRL